MFPGNNIISSQFPENIPMNKNSIRFHKTNEYRIENGCITEMQRTKTQSQWLFLQSSLHSLCPFLVRLLSVKHSVCSLCIRYLSGDVRLRMSSTEKTGRRTDVKRTHTVRLTDKTDKKRMKTSVHIRWCVLNMLKIFTGFTA